MPITKTLPVLETRHGVAYRVTYHRFETSTGVKTMRCYEARRHMDRVPLVRINSKCEFGEVMDSDHCDCGLQLQAFKQELKDYGRGVLVYTDQEGRGHGLETKMEDMALQWEHGIDHEESLRRMGLAFDLRFYDEEVEALKEIRLPAQIIHFSRNQLKAETLRRGGFEIVKEFEWCDGLSPAALAERQLKGRMPHYHYRDPVPVAPPA